MFEKSDIIFTFPFFSVMILGIIFLIVIFAWINRYRRRHLKLLTQSKSNYSLIFPRSQSLSRAKQIGWILVWIFGCLALMDPINNIHYPILDSDIKSKAGETYPPYEVIFVVDTSASMGSKDSPDDLTRLDSAKNIAEDVLRQLEGETVSLYAFTSVLTQLVPPTLDYLFARLALKEMHIDGGEVGGTHFSVILQQLQQQLSSQPPYPKAIIFLSDGGDTLLENLKDKDFTQEQSKIVNSLSTSPQILFFAIGVGGQKDVEVPNVKYKGHSVQSKLYSEILLALSKKMQGIYYTAYEESSLSLAQDILAVIKTHMQISEKVALISEQSSTIVNSSDQQFDRYFQIPAVIALLIYIINLLLPDTRQ